MPFKPITNVAELQEALSGAPGYNYVLRSTDDYMKGTESMPPTITEMALEETNRANGHQASFDPFNEYVGHKISVIIATGISIEGHLTGIQGEFLVMSSGKVQKQYVVHVRRLAMSNEGGGPRPTY